MTQQLRVAGALGAAIAALMALALPVAILLLLDPASSSACGGTPTGPGPSSVPGVPQRFLPIYEGAAQQFGLGSDGWAYLAALNYRREQLRRRQRPRHRRALRQQLRGGGRPDANRNRRRRDRQLVNRRRTDPSQPARGCAAAERVQRDRRRLRRRDPAQALGSARGLARGARRLEQLPARDRPGHTARRAVHQHRPGAGRRARRVRRRCPRAGRDACR